MKRFGIEPLPVHAPKKTVIAINSLAGGALLARAGKRVLVLERNDWLGGAIRTGEITVQRGERAGRGSDAGAASTSAPRHSCAASARSIAATVRGRKRSCR